MTYGKKRIVILGATSAIAEATARIWAAQGARLVVVARDKGRLDAIAADLQARGATEAATVALDCSKANANVELDAMLKTLGGFDIVLLAYGTLGDQKRSGGRSRGRLRTRSNQFHQRCRLVPGSKRCLGTPTFRRVACHWVSCG